MKIKKPMGTALLVIMLVSCGVLRHGAARAASVCTVTASSLPAIAADAASVAPGGTVCVAAGTYDGELVLSAAPGSNITIEPVPGAIVTFTNSNAGVGIAVDFASSASNITLYDFYLTSEIYVEAGASNITISHNDITGGYFGIAGGGENCAVANNPTPCATFDPAISNITISGNRLHNFGYQPGGSDPVDQITPAPEPNSEDALHFNNFSGLHITANEITATEEGGNHTDCFQTVWGGSNLTFDHNYEHDNQCQGFFLKDGDVTNASATDNMFVRDRVESLDQSDLQVFNTSPLTIRGNTFWDDQGNVIRADDPSFNPPTAAVDHNIFELFNVLNDSGTAYQLTEDYDILKNDPFTFARGAHSTVVTSPSFVNTASDNYQLSSNPNSIGVDWSPAQYTYGHVTTTAEASAPPSDSGGSGAGAAAVNISTPAAAQPVQSTPVKLKTVAAATSGTTPTPPADGQDNLTISGLKVTDITQSSATVSWQTNEPATSTVRYGLDSNLNLSATAAGSTTSHSIRLTGGILKPGLQYSVQAESTDARGSQASSAAIMFHTRGLSLIVALTDRNGKALKGVRVTLDGQTQTSGTNGEVSFSDLPYGSRTFTTQYGSSRTTGQVNLGVPAADGGYTTQTVNFQLAAGHNWRGLANGLIAAGCAAVIILLVPRLKRPAPPSTKNWTSIGVS